eukprot:TRINITY_DN108418_c0_g1_i1.p1 TRINITY_DN108418_c0_g1~~TRINITY_DN108418_c0_g1_i1.p1  ORF type:complete len:264 (-),score=46.27 TRINITY_DN108418_c0_g1_i1:80-871(-)
MLLPTLGLLSGHVWALVADRYAYIPCMCILMPGLAALANACCKVLTRCQILLPAGAGLVLASVAWRADEVASLWAGGSQQLFEAILHQSPDEFSTLKDLGTLHLQRGSFADGQRLFSAALALRPDHGGLLLNMATLLHKSKRTREAESMYRRACSAIRAAVAKCPGCKAPMTELAKAEANFGGLMLQLGRAAEAAAILEAGSPWEGATESACAPGLHHLCLAYAALGRDASAARLCRAAARESEPAKALLSRYELPVSVSGLR